jgi:hypothetical protein
VFPAAEVTQSFLPRAFGPTGDVLGISRIWEAAGIDTNRFVTPTSNNHYIQGEDIVLDRVSTSTADFSLTEDSIVFGSPNIRAVFGFRWTTYRTGALWDTAVENGFGRVDVNLNEYSYRVKFSSNTQNKHVATIEDFKCVFNLPASPIFDGTVTETTRQLFATLKGPMEASLNNSFSAIIKNTLQTTMNTLLTNAQSSQTLSWSYGGRSLSKTINLTPTTLTPFRDGNFVIITSGDLQKETPQISEQIFGPKHPVSLISDSTVGAQNDDICFVFTDGLLDNLVTANTDFFSLYQINLNKNSGHQQYYPFNLWQFWEVTLYDLTLFSKIGTGEGQFAQTDTISMFCNFTQNADAAVILQDGRVQVGLHFRCLLNILNSRTGTTEILKDFTFDQTLTARFSVSGNALNAAVEAGEITNIQNVIVDSPNVRSDLANRFQIPLNSEIKNNAKIFGLNGLRFNHISGKTAAPSRVGENLSICFR